MNNRKTYSGLDFKKTTPKFSKRWIAILAVPVIFLILNAVIPTGLFILPMIIFLAVLTWIASYGWNKAYARFILFLQNHQSHGES